MKVLVVDTETNGLPKGINPSITETHNWPHILQISFILYDDETHNIRLHAESDDSHTKIKLWHQDVELRAGEMVRLKARLRVKPGESYGPTKNDLSADDLKLYALGKEVYAREAHCVTCHQAEGKGVRGFYPGLAKSEWLEGDQKRAIKIRIT